MFKREFANQYRQYNESKITKQTAGFLKFDNNKRFSSVQASGIYCATSSLVFVSYE